MSWWRRIGCATSRVSPASSGTGSVHTSWCCTATSGIGTPAIAPTRRPPDPGAEQDPLALDVALGRCRTPCTRPSRMSKPVTVTPPSKATPLASALRASAAAMPHRLRDAVRRARGTRRGSSRGRAAGSARRSRAGVSSSRALDAVRAGEPLPALELLASARAWWRPRCSPTPYQPGSPSSVELVVQRDRVLRDAAHRARAVRLEHQARRVRGRAAGLEQRPLVEHEDVGRDRARPGDRRRSRRRCRRRRSPSGHGRATDAGSPRSHP